MKKNESVALFIICTLTVSVPFFLRKPTIISHLEILMPSVPPKLPSQEEIRDYCRKRMRI